MLPKSVNLIGSRGGIPDLTGMDVAAGLANCPCEHAYIVLTAKYCYDVQSCKQLQKMLTEIARSRIQGLNHPEGEKQAALYIMTLLWIQHMGGYKCGTCKGAGERDSKICPTCQGSTWGQISDRKRAELLHVGKDMYRRKWRPVVYDMEMDLISWGQAGLAHLNRQMRDTV